MPRKPLIRSSTLPYHVTARANNREPFYVPLERAWQVLEAHCFEICLLYEVHIHAFVVMNNHFHLLITVPNEDLGKVMMYFMRSATWTLNRLSGRSGHAFGGRYHWSLIDSEIYFAHAFKYIYRNPVRAGVCERVEHYPYSTLSGLLGFQHQLLPILSPYEVNGNPSLALESPEFLEWLNHPFQKEQEEAIKKSFRRSRFDCAKGGWKRSSVLIK